MSPDSILRDIAAEGLRLALSGNGGIKLVGAETTINHWLPVVREHKAALIGALLQDSPAHHWLLRFADLAPQMIVCAPAATQAQVLADNPTTIAAEPFTPTPVLPEHPLSAEDESAIRNWLAAIGETDADCIAEVLDGCNQDQAARDYFLGRASELNRAALAQDTPEQSQDATRFSALDQQEADNANH